MDSAAKNKKITTKDMVLAGMFAAILAIISQFSIPMPTGVPISMQLFGVTLMGVVLGWRLGILSTLAYILIGAAGIPVFSSFRGGLGVLTGLTGGYILGWPLMVAFCGIRHNSANKTKNFYLTIAFCLIGLILDELIGGLQWAFLAGDQSFFSIMIYSLTAFVPKDIVLTVLAAIAGLQIRHALTRSRHI